MANKITVNLDTSKNQYNIYDCKQNDDLILEAKIYESGKEKDVSAAEIIVNCTRSDGTYVIQNTEITKEKNKIIANLKRDFTRVAGLDRLELVLIENEKQNTTFDFNILVKPSVLKAAVEESKNTVTILEELGNKIVQAGAAKAETELLIKNGNAATKGDIATVNSHLEQNKKNIENLNNNKMDKNTTEISINQINKNLGKIDQTFLSDELLQQITGNTPVTSVPSDNSVTTNKIVNKAITNSKLADNFIGRETITTGSIGDILADGIYRVGDGVLNNPLGAVTSVFITFKCDVLYYQFIYNQSNVTQFYCRITSNPSSTTNWKQGGVMDGGITNSKLSDSFNYRGVVTTGSVNDYLKDGLYYLGKDITDNPLGNLPSFLINYNADNRIYQQIFTHSNPNNKYERIVDKNTQLTDLTKWKNSDTQKPLIGKKIVHFGDSILQYGNYSTKIASITGATTYNCGIGGGTLAIHPVSYYAPLSLVNLIDNIISGDFTSAENGANALYNHNGDDKRHIIALLKTIDFSTVDIITIAYGTNEMGNKVTLGESNSTDKTTFNGALNYVIKSLMTKYPKIKIYFFTPIYRTKLGSSGNEDGLTYVMSNGLKLLDYVDTVIARGQERGCPVYDAFRNMGINYYNSSYYLADGLHPNDIGDTRLAEEYSKFIVSN